MCTGLRYNACMGRNFDYEKSYNEEIITVEEGRFGNKYPIIGVGTGFIEDYPLLYDGMNCMGLCCAGLAFTGNAEYNGVREGMVNVPSYDLTFQILSHFDSVGSLRKELDVLNITLEDYSKDLPSTDLHWFVCDKDESLVIEQTSEGLGYYDAKTNVLTNNPPYPLQLDNYQDEKEYIGCIAGYNSEKWLTRGIETDNLKGGYTSEERFIRASYLRDKLELADSPFDDVTETFHLLSSVEQVYGLTPVEDRFEYTIYSAVYDMNDLLLYVKTYEGNHNHNDGYPIHQFSGDWRWPL